jgi:hypothetical protein
VGQTTSLSTGWTLKMGDSGVLAGIERCSITPSCALDTVCFPAVKAVVTNAPRNAAPLAKSISSSVLICLTLLSLSVSKEPVTKELPEHCCYSSWQILMPVLGMLRSLHPVSKTAVIDCGGVPTPIEIRGTNEPALSTFYIGIENSFGFCLNTFA